MKVLRPLVLIALGAILTGCAAPDTRAIPGGQVTFYGEGMCQISVPEQFDRLDASVQVFVLHEALTGQTNPALQVSRPYGDLPETFEVYSGDERLFELTDSGAYLPRRSGCIAMDLSLPAPRQVPCDLGNTTGNIPERFYVLTPEQRDLLADALDADPGTLLELRSDAGALFFAFPPAIPAFLRDWAGTCRRLKSGS